MKFKRMPMVGWYDTKQLASTAVKTVLSGVFGSYSDKREIQAFAAQQDYFNFSDKEEIWIDYISDLGDGFDATYTMAHLMAQEEIQIDGDTLPRGDILVMGGDEVYPTPEKHEYRNRLQGPYNAAFPWKNDEPKEIKPRLFVIPGNHDWYDGLTNFIRLFCQGRALGNRLTMQKRSYFAIKLPHNYWLLGIDIQLKGDIDDPQIAYFRNVAANEFKDGDKVLLCTAEPTWVYAALSEDFESDDRLNFFINRVLKCQDPSYGHPAKDIHIEAILTGDLHHYSRYELNTGHNTTQLITAGGGGAFMHPTHPLIDQINFANGTTAKLKSTFPSFKDSRKLAWLNLGFPYYNWTMCLFFGIFHLFTSWFLQSNTYLGDEPSFMEKMALLDISLYNLLSYPLIIFRSIRHSPSVVLLNLILFLGILVFTDTYTGKKKWNYIAGFFHATLQLANLYVCIWIFSIINLQILDLHINGLAQMLLFAAEMIVVGGMLSGFIFGIYLLVSSLVFHSHPTEASSSFRHQGYKNFLRIHIDKNKLTIYPIGLKSVVHNWKNTGTEEKPRFEGDPIEYSLIEKQAIDIIQKP